MVESWKKLKTSNVFSSFFVCQNRNGSAPVRELLSNNSLLVGQLYEDKSFDLLYNLPPNSELLARADLFINYSRLFCCNHTCYCVGIHPRSDSTEFREIGRGSSDCFYLVCGSR